MAAVHLPGCTNIEADFESRRDRHQIEWHLDPIVFQAITRQLGICDIDLFTSRVNRPFRAGNQILGDWQ